MPNIGQKTIKECADHLEGLLQTYSERLNQAYRNIEEGGLDVKLSLKIKPFNGGNKVVAGISFVVEKENDTSSFSVDEEQMSMEFGEGGYQS